MLLYEEVQSAMRECRARCHDLGGDAKGHIDGLIRDIGKAKSLPDVSPDRFEVLVAAFKNHAVLPILPRSVLQVGSFRASIKS